MTSSASYDALKFGLDSRFVSVDMRETSCPVDFRLATFFDRSPFILTSPVSGPVLWFPPGPVPLAVINRPQNGISRRERNALRFGSPVRDGAGGGESAFPGGVPGKGLG